MSTFIGILSKRGKDIPVENLRSMIASSQNHHDQESIIGIRRDLSITPLPRELSQEHAREMLGVCFLGMSHSELEGNPIPQNSVDTVTTLFDGEVYAYQGVDLKEEDEPYHDFISRMFMRDGSDTLHNLNAQFMALILDQRKQEIILARDKHGSKSVFYTENADYFSFANAARFLFTSPGYQVAMDEEGFWNNLSFPAPPQPQTVYKGIHALERGHYLTVGDKTEIHRYYRIEVNRQEKWDDQEAGQMIDEAMKKSIKRRVKGKASIGAPISGGVDSPYICAHAAQHINNLDVYTFSLSDPAFAPMNEHEKAALTAHKYGMNHRVKFYSVQDLFEDFDKIIEMYDQIGNNFGTYYYVAKQAAEGGNGTVLTGLAADEIHGGFHYFKFIKLWQAIKLFPAITSLIPRGYSSRMEDLKNLSLAKSIDDYYAHAFSKLKEREKHLLFPHSKGYHSHRSIHELYNHDNLKFTDDVEGLLYFMFANVPNHHLYRFEQFANHFGLKVRHPFLDDDVVDVAFRVPSVWKVKGDVRKIALKRAAKPYLPPESLVKKKLGLMLPLGSWLNNELADFAHTHINDLKKRPEVSPAGVDYMVKTYQPIKPAKIMKLIMIELWFKRFMDQ